MFHLNLCDMKKVVALFIFLFFSVILFAQEEITFNLSSSKSMYSVKMFPVYINGTEAVRLKNGGSSTIKMNLDVSKPVTVRVENGFAKREITFNLSPGNKICEIEITISRQGVDIRLLSGGKLAPGTGLKSNLTVNQKNLSVSYTSEKTDASDTIRLQWLEKGGKIKGSSNVYGANFTYMKKPEYKMIGFGGLYNSSLRFLNFRIPEYKPGLRSWASLVYGLSEMYQINFNTITMKIEGMDPVESNSTSVVMMMSPDLGFTFGLGKFKTPTKWKGAALELTYRPSVMVFYSFSEGNSASDASFNWTGFSVDVNFNSFVSNAAKLAPKAQSKLTFFFLPPLKDIPLYISVGYGLTIYNHRK